MIPNTAYNPDSNFKDLKPELTEGELTHECFELALELSKTDKDIVMSILENYRQSDFELDGGRELHKRELHKRLTDVRKERNK